MELSHWQLALLREVRLGGRAGVRAPGSLDQYPRPRSSPAGSDAIGLGLRTDRVPGDCNAPLGLGSSGLGRSGGERSQQELSSGGAGQGAARAVSSGGGRRERPRLPPGGGGKSRSAPHRGHWEEARARAVGSPGLQGLGVVPRGHGGLWPTGRWVQMPKPESSGSWGDRQRRE